MKFRLFRIRNAASGLGAIILILALGVSAGNGANLGARLAAVQSGHKAISAQVDHQRLREAMAVQNRHTAQLIRIPGVVGFGTGIGAAGR